MDDERIEAFRRAVHEAVSSGKRMRLRLRGGEVLEGVPTFSAGFGKTPMASSEPVPRDEQQHYGPPEFVVTIDGQEILAQEVEYFEVIE